MQQITTLTQAAHTTHINAEKAREAANLSLKNEAEKNKKLSGMLQKYADGFQKLRNENESLLATVNSQNAVIDTLRRDNKLLTDTNVHLTNECSNLSSTLMIAAREYSSMASPIHDSINVISSLFDFNEQTAPSDQDLELDLAQSQASYQPKAPGNVETIDLDAQGDLAIDMSQMESDLADISKRLSGDQEA